LFTKRFALVKSSIALGVLIFALTCCLVLFSHLFYPETKGFDIELQKYEPYRGIDNLFLFYSSIAALVWLLFLPLAYFKLKEKQV
jgi:hypothetical protein